MTTRFQEYTTSTAFRLELTKRMIEMLFQVWLYDNAWYFGGTIGALERRGLVERASKGVYRITSEGTAVIGLLQYAGFSNVDIPIPFRPGKVG